MNTAHDLMEQLQGDGARLFAATRLANDQSGVVRKVRRDRAVRASVLSVAGVAVAGAAAVGVAHLGAGTVPPAGSASPQPSITSSPTISASVSVSKQERIEDIAADLAAEFGASESEAMDALAAALPSEANGNPEGWVIGGEYTFDASASLQDAANQLVSVAVGYLESAGVPREDWLDTVILASIVQYEAPTGPSDQSRVARVLLNRIDEGMPLQIESPLAYYLHADTELVGDDGWSVDTPYNTYMYEGLPPSAVGAPTHEALESAVEPADGDWLFFLTKPDGNALVFTTYEEFAVAVDEVYRGTGASG